jgi:hypothetical protein
MSDDLVKRARRTALWEGHGEQSDLPEQMADRIEDLERQVGELARELLTVQAQAAGDYGSARNAALEEAAERCDSIRSVHHSSPSIMLGCVLCRDAIRALKAVP